jgi:hypothetical protein
MVFSISGLPLRPSHGWFVERHVHEVTLAVTAYDPMNVSTARRRLSHIGSGSLKR